jgi:hypothetical protein
MNFTKSTVIQFSVKVPLTSADIATKIAEEVTAGKTDGHITTVMLPGGAEIIRNWVDQDSAQGWIDWMKSTLALHNESAALVSATIKDYTA